MLGTQTRILVNRWDFSSGFFQAETERQVAEKENTSFGVLATTYEPGLESNHFNLRGYYTGAQASSAYKEFSTRVGIEGLNMRLGILIDDSDPNCVALVGPNAWGQMLKVNLAAPELITFEITTSQALNVIRGLRLYEGTITATGTNATLDLGSSGSNGGYVFAFIRTVVPNNSPISLSVASSTTEGGTYTNHAVLTYQDPKFMNVPITGSINRWVRLTTDSLGGATSTRVCVIVAVKDVTY